MGIIERKSGRRCSRQKDCSRCENQRCYRHNQCGRGGICTSNFNKCIVSRPKYDDFLDMIEETKPKMDIEESNTDLDYGNTGY